MPIVQVVRLDPEQIERLTDPPREIAAGGRHKTLKMIAWNLFRSLGIGDASSLWQLKYGEV